MSDIRFNQWLHQSGTGGVSQSDGGHVGIGTTNPLLPVGAGNTNILHVGVVTSNSISAGSSITATTFYGSGANLTSLPSQLTLSNNADNRVITGGSGTNLNGEANLTFDGSKLTVNRSSDGSIVQSYRTGNTSGGGTELRVTDGYSSTVPLYAFWYNNNTGIGNPAANTTSFIQNSSEKLRINSSGSIQITPEGSTSNPYMLIDTSGDSVRFSAQKASGNNEFRFLTQSSGTVAERLRIANDGKITVAANGDIRFTNGTWTGEHAGKIQHNSNNLYIQGGTGGIRFRHASSGTNQFSMTNGGNFEITNGDLVVASGHGIDFSADGNASGNTSELLHDYEEGTWSANNLNYDYDGNQAQRGSYIKIGRVVHAFFRVKFHNQSNYTGQHLRFTGLPFTAANGNPYDIGIACFAQEYTTKEFTIYVQPGSTYAYWYTFTGSNYNNSTSLNGADLRGCITYTASA